MGMLEDMIAQGDFQGAGQNSAFFQGAQQQSQLTNPAAYDTRGKIGDPALRAAATQLDAKAMAAQMMQQAEQEKQQRMLAILQAIKGASPDIQAVVGQQLGFKVNPGEAEARKLKGEKELITTRAKAAAEASGPQNAIENQLKLMGIQRQQQQGTNELDLKRQQGQAEQGSRAHTQNIQLMRVLATMAQSNPQLGQALGPLLMQMLQQNGINLQAPTTGTSPTPPRAGVTIRRVE